ncbi:type II restriction endonuclease, partial [Bacillus pumilus]
MNPLLIIRSAQELITSRTQTRSGFIEAALAKNKKGRPYIEQARTLRAYALAAENPQALLGID